MPKHTEPAAGVDPTPCNCLALRQASRHISQIYDRQLAQAGLRTTQYSILAKARPAGRDADQQIGRYHGHGAHRAQPFYWAA